MTTIVKTLTAPFTAVTQSLSFVSTGMDMLGQYVDDAASKQQANRANVLAEQANDIASTALDIRKETDKLSDAVMLYEAERILALAQARVKRASVLAKAASANINADIAELRIAAMNGMPQATVLKQMAAIQARKATYDKLMTMTTAAPMTSVEEEEASTDMDEAAAWLSASPL